MLLLLLLLLLLLPRYHTKLKLKRHLGSRTGKGCRAKDGRVVRNSATSRGRFHRSILTRSVTWAGQANRQELSVSDSKISKVSQIVMGS
jgi:hypothetical protein